MIRRNEKQEFEDLVKKLEPIIEKGFLDSISQIVDGAPFSLLVAHAKSGRFEAFIFELDIEPSAFGNLYIALLNSYQIAGTAGAKVTKTQLKKLKSTLLNDAGQPSPVVTKFDLTDSEVDQFLKKNIGSMISSISEQTKAEVRRVLIEGLKNKESPTKLTQRIIGRINRATGKREGGLIGLTPAQQKWVENARKQLENLDRKYLDRELRDRRHDWKVADAIREGRQLTPAEIEMIAGNYAKKLLRRRAKDIALTETITAVNATRMLLFAKAARERKINLAWVDKGWVSSGDNRVRHTHRILNGKWVTYAEKFNSPSGTMLEYPGDPSAPVEERVGCRCRLRLKVNTERMNLGRGI